MPLRIWVPSWAAGPVKTAACPSRILSAVTPGCCCAAAGSTMSAPNAKTIFFMGYPSSSHTDRQKIRMPHQLRHVKLLPRLSLCVVELAALPSRRLAARGARRQLVGITQPERAIDEQRRRRTEAFPEQQESRALAYGHSADAQKGGEIDHAVEVAAHVGHAFEPGARQ